MGKTRVVRLSGVIALALILAGVGGLALAQDAEQQEQPAGQQEPKAEPQEPQTDEAVRTDFVARSSSPRRSARRTPRRCRSRSPR